MSTNQIPLQLNHLQKHPIHLMKNHYLSIRIVEDHFNL